MLHRLKSTLIPHLRNAREKRMTEIEERYVAGKDAENSPIAHAVLVPAVEEILEGAPFRWGCTACGHCCSGPGAVYFTAEDLKKLRDHLDCDDEVWEDLYARLIQKKSRGLFVHQTNRACILLDKNGRCTAYPARPLQCHTYPFWSSSFESAASHRELLRACPGVNNPEGEAFTLRELVLRVNQTADTFNRSQTGAGKTLYL